jgi:predicted  nucleic acid-binding Zn-ribbon protein
MTRIVCVDCGNVHDPAPRLMTRCQMCGSENLDKEVPGSTMRREIVRMLQDSHKDDLLDIMAFVQRKNEARRKAALQEWT